MAGSRGAVVTDQTFCESFVKVRSPISPEAVTTVAVAELRRKVTVRSALTSGERTMAGVGDEAGVVGKDVGLVKLIAVGMGVLKVLQDVNAVTKTPKNIALLIIF